MTLRCNNQTFHALYQGVRSRTLGRAFLAPPSIVRGLVDIATEVEVEVVMGDDIVVRI